MTIKGLWLYYKKSVGYGKIILSDLKGKLVAIDAFAVMFYQLRCAAKKVYLGSINPVLDDVDEDVIDERWFRNALGKITGYLSEGVIPVLVYDGPKNEMKEETLAKREKVQSDAKKSLLLLKEKYEDDEIPENDLEKARQCLMKINAVPQNSRERFIKFFKDLGIPWVLALGEAEKTCALMNRDGIVAASITPDSDYMAYGGLLQLTTKTKVRRGITTYDGYETASLDKMLESLEMNLELFQEVCIMSGTDMNENIKNCSWCSAVKHMKKHESITRFARKTKTDVTSLNHLEMRKEFAVVPWRSTVMDCCTELTHDNELVKQISKNYNLDKFLAAKEAILSI